MLEHLSDSHHGQRIRSQRIAGISLTEIVYAPLLKVPSHSHRHACFGLVLQGAYDEIYRNKTLTSGLSNIKFRPAEESHSNYYGSSKVRCFLIEPEGEWLARLCAHAGLHAPLIFRDNSLVWLALKIRGEARRMDEVTPMAIEGLMLEMLAEAARRSARMRERRHPRWLEQAREILHGQFSGRLTLSQIAETVEVHPVYLASAFRQHYGCSIGEYVRKLRVEVACHELSTTDTPLVDIALAAGFSHQAHFSRTFKRLTGMTPACYRSSFRLS